MTTHVNFTYSNGMLQLLCLCAMFVLILINGIAEGQTADTIRANATLLINSDPHESIEKVLLIQKKDGHGKASVVPENRRIIVFLKHEHLKIKGNFSIQDKDTMEINGQLVAFDSIEKIWVPRKQLFLRIFGGIEFTLAFLSVFTYVAPIVITYAFPFIIGTVFILTASRKYNLVNKHKVKVLMGNPQFRQQSVGMTGNNLENFSSFNSSYIDLMSLNNR